MCVVTVFSKFQVLSVFSSGRVQSTQNFTALPALEALSLNPKHVNA